MNAFTAQWLDLREGLDAASRAQALCTALVEDLAARQPRTARTAIIDLGAGTGANLRYAAPRLGGSQDWVLVERDPLLLGAIEGRTRTRARMDCRVRRLALDLARELHRVPMPDGALLTASALLDLVSGEWLRELARRADAARALVWFTLTYDGRIECEPAEPEDAEVRELFNRHQLLDKGFGPALGPGATDRASQVFAQRGYVIHRAPSDWRLGPGEPALQHALIDGWYEAACEIAPARAPLLEGWLARRRAHIEAGRSQLRVGHQDLLGLPRVCSG